MSVVGVGVDLVVVSRFTATMERTPGLARRLFNVDEREGAPSSVAGRFAAKEAIAKALGAPGNLAWTDARVLNTAAGQPYFEVTGSVAARAKALGGTASTCRSRTTATSSLRWWWPKGSIRRIPTCRRRTRTSSNCARRTT